MADTVTTQVHHNDGKRYVATFTNNSDGTGESAVKKVDISTLTKTDGTAPTKVQIDGVAFSVSTGMSVLLAFDHTTDDTVLILTGTGSFSYQNIGGLKDPASAGGTGDIMFTTIGQSANDTYTIKLNVKIS